MAWEGSTRWQRLPANWGRLRGLVFHRKGRACYLCGKYATEVDHVEPGDNHSLANLQPICGYCHKRKSSSEGGKAAQAKRPRRTRPPERHPGMINGR